MVTFVLGDISIYSRTKDAFTHNDIRLRMIRSYLNGSHRFNRHTHTHTPNNRLNGTGSAFEVKSKSNLSEDFLFVLRFGSVGVHLWLFDATDNRNYMNENCVTRSNSIYIWRNVISKSLSISLFSVVSPASPKRKKKHFPDAHTHAMWDVIDFHFDGRHIVKHIRGSPQLYWLLYWYYCATVCVWPCWR